MKGRLFAMTLAALFVVADGAPAGLISFTGVIDEVGLSGTAMPFAVGDPFSATFHFVGPPHPSGLFQRAITSFTVALGDFTITGSQDGSLAVQIDVTHTNLLYQVFHASSANVDAPYSFSDTNILIYDPAVGGVVPPFDRLSINFFDVALSSPQFESDFARGHLTSFPMIASTPGPAVPEGGSPVNISWFFDYQRSVCAAILVTGTSFGSLPYDALRVAAAHCSAYPRRLRSNR